MSFSGVPIIYGIDEKLTESVPSHQLGAIGVTSDGRKFRYAQNNATNAATAGYLQQAPAEIANHQNLTPTAASVGDTSVTVTLGGTAATANQYADGYLVVTSTAGNGIYYKIRDHVAQATTTGTVAMNLAEPVRVAITASSTIDLVPNPYKLVIVNPTTATGLVVGVAQSAMAASYYGWLQTGGIGIAANDNAGTVGVGVNVSASNAVAGKIEAAVTAQAAIGIAASGISASQEGMVFFTLD